MRYAMLLTALLVGCSMTGSTRRPSSGAISVKNISAALSMYELRVIDGAEHLQGSPLLPGDAITVHLPAGDYVFKGIYEDGDTIFWRVAIPPSHQGFDVDETWPGGIVGPGPWSLP